MRKRVIAAIGASLAAAVFVTWIIVRSGDSGRTETRLTESSGSVQPLTPEEQLPKNTQGQRGHKRKDDGPNYPWISAGDLKARLDRGEKVLVINTRSNTSEPFIKGALDISEDDIETWADTMPKSTAVVTYCSCDGDSAGVRAALKLRWRGFTDVHVLRGGLDAWQEAGYATQPAKTPGASAR